MKYCIKVYNDTGKFKLKMLTLKIQRSHNDTIPGEITGSRLLDIGTGPVWYKVYAASWWFGEITLSDISEDNLACLRDWKNGILREQDNMIKYILDVDGNR